MSEEFKPSDHSFVPVAADSQFPIQNLPYGVVRPRAGGPPRVGVAIGEMVLDLAVIEDAGLFTGPALAGRRIFGSTTLNEFLALGRAAWSEARETIARLLSADCDTLQRSQVLRDRALHGLRDATLLLPAAIGDYTDFYSSREHATNVGAMFRGRENALMPNWLHLPVAYHGRSSSVVVSGTDVRRPRGQVLPTGADRPVFGPTRRLDFELEVGFFVGPGNELGQPITVERAADHIFGLVLVNDWSARDIQRWEYQPLGPFLAKNFATSISPWVVPLEALLPFRTQGPAQDPPPLPYLRSEGPWSFDINLEVLLETAQSAAPAAICRSNFKFLYWDMRQQLAHHTISGCNLRPGDLLASGTISGPEPTSRGSLLELTWNGAEPLRLPSGEQRTFLEDGDRVTMTGWATRGGVRVGFGDVTGRILPALPD